jgi:hypothetical protein
MNPKTFICSHCHHQIDIENEDDYEMIIDHMAMEHGWNDEMTLEQVRERLDAVGGWILWDKQSIPGGEKNEINKKE